MTVKLTIELVPSTSWFNNVRAVVTKPQWDAIKKKVSSKAYDACEICGGIGPKHPVECHEIWHYDDKKFIQKLEGMIALCPNCHMVKHIGLAGIQNRGEQALKHLMQVNQLSRDKAEKLVVDAFEVWGARSSHNWKLDITHLKEYGIDVSKLKRRPA